MSNNVLINIMLRRVGERIWECRATCPIHDCSGLAADIDDKEKVLREALKKLQCDCWGG